MTGVLAKIPGHLAQYPAVTALIADRIYPDFLPQNVDFPAIVYHEIDEFSEQHLNGTSGLAQVRVQFDFYGSTVQELEALREATRLALQAFRGDMGGVRVEGVSHLGGGALPYQPDRKRHGKRMDLRIWHRETKI